MSRGRVRGRCGKGSASRKGDDVAAASARWKPGVGMMLSVACEGRRGLETPRPGRVVQEVTPAVLTGGGARGCRCCAAYQAAARVRTPAIPFSRPHTTPSYPAGPGEHSLYLPLCRTGAQGIPPVGSGSPTASCGR